MKKLYQADGSYKIQIEASDTDLLAKIGGKPRTVNGTYTADTEANLNPHIVDALATATDIAYVAPPVPTEEEENVKICEANLAATDTLMARYAEDIHDATNAALAAGATSIDGYLPTDPDTGEAYAIALRTERERWRQIIRDGGTINDGLPLERI